MDSVRWSPDTLKMFNWKANVSSYINEFRNVGIGISNINEDEKLDKFVLI